MKKNFMAIASLLIAAMLLVVSCAPEANVEGKVEDGLVEAVIGLGRSAKDIKITDDYAGTDITYKYTLKAAWKPEDTGAPIYGEVATEKELFTTTSFSETVSNKSLGKVTPGLWNIEVKGYCKVNDVEKLVLQGKASAYFNGTRGEKATVFVAPVSDGGTVSVTIKLKMQDLEDTEVVKYDKIGYAFTNLAGNSSIVEDPATTHEIIVDSTTGHVNTYAETTVNVKSGFNTVTFSLPGYESGKGGITKTFLAIPGVPVTIEGSVTPAEFVEGTAEIKFLSIEGGNVTVAAKTGTGSAAVADEVVTIKPAGETAAVTVTVKKLANGGTYTFTYDGSSEDDNINNTVGVNATRSYQWYVGEKPIDGATGSTYDFTESVAGDYNVTCVATVSFTKDGQEYNLRTSATLANVRVLEATPQN